MIYICKCYIFNKMYTYTYTYTYTYIIYIYILYTRNYPCVYPPTPPHKAHPPHRPAPTPAAAPHTPRRAPSPHHHHPMRSAGPGPPRRRDCCGGPGWRIWRNVNGCKIFTKNIPGISSGIPWKISWDITITPYSYSLLYPINMIFQDISGI